MSQNPAGLPALRVASFPGRGNPNNPYVDLFYDAMEKHAVGLVQELEPTSEWIQAHREKVDAVHLHWPDVTWRSFTPSRNRRVRAWVQATIPGAWRVIGLVDRVSATPWAVTQRQKRRKLVGVLHFLAFLRQAKRNGLRIIWTFHNVEAHEGADWMDRWGYRRLARSSDLMIFHSQGARQEAVKRYQPKGALVVMPHGNYRGVYPTPRPREVVFDELGLDPNVPVVSCLGMMREYKGLDTACEAMRFLGGHVHLLCAGAPHASLDLDSLRRLAARAGNVTIVPRFLSNQEFADYAAISSALLLPYRRVTGSGALLAALSLSRGVIASDLPFFRDVLGSNTAAGTLVPPESPRALSEAIKDYLKLPSETREEAAALLADRYNWCAVVQPVVEVIGGWQK